MLWLLALACHCRIRSSFSSTPQVGRLVLSQPVLAIFSVLTLRCFWLQMLPSRRRLVWLCVSLSLCCPILLPLVLQRPPLKPAMGHVAKGIASSTAPCTHAYAVVDSNRVSALHTHLCCG